jgi:hypothetical protein
MKRCARVGNERCRSPLGGVHPPRNSLHSLPSLLQHNAEGQMLVKLKPTKMTPHPIKVHQLDGGWLFEMTAMPGEDLSKVADDLGIADMKKIAHSALLGLRECAELVRTLAHAHNKLCLDGHILTDNAWCYAEHRSRGCEARQHSVRCGQREGGHD